MSVEVTIKESQSIVSEISLDIFNNLDTGVFIFGADKSVKDINQIGLLLVSAIFPDISSIETAKELTLDKIFSEKNFPGWLDKFESENYESGVWLSEYLNTPLDCGNRIYFVKAGSVLSKSGESLFVVLINDITNEKKSQHRLAWLEKQAEKGSMAAIIVHDLNNYLSLLLGGAELAEMMLSSGKTDKAADKIEKIKINVKKMEKFIAGFTDDYKIETNKIKANLNNLISNVVLCLSTRDIFTDISIITHLDSQIPEFEIDTDQFSRLLLNFLNNSAEAINESETKHGKVTINTELDNTNIVLTISDNGPGLTEDVKQKIFRRRFTSKENHTGYGLMDCGLIVGIHNGQVEIVENTDAGAAFEVTLPIE